MPQQKPKNDYERLSREIEQDVRQAVEAVGAAFAARQRRAKRLWRKRRGRAFGGAARRPGAALGGAAGAAAQGFRTAAVPARRAAEKSGA